MAFSSYTEGVNLLYSRNTFIFLQNSTLSDFHRNVLPERLACIRSVHIHWQFRETMASRSTMGFGCEYLYVALSALSKSNLDHISIFLQGPLYLGETYKQTISLVETLVASRLRPPKLFVVRFPQINSDPFFGNIFSQEVDTLLATSELPFEIVQPSRTIFVEPEDLEVGVDAGWRYGVIFLPSDGTDNCTSGFTMRSYMVWTPMPFGLRWPWRI